MEKGMETLVQRMVKSDMTKAEIARVTGLSTDEVQALAGVKRQKM